MKVNKVDKYIPSEIEAKWRDFWKSKDLFRFVPGENNYYCLVELPYPSGDLHLGHWFTFICADSLARYKKMSGSNVFFPNGFDAFGLPAENAAIKRGIHPRDWTLRNIASMKKQFDTMGSMIDWSHEAITCEPEYYKWNQWIFLKMYEKGLAYRDKSLSNWCPNCQTVLANEAIEDGKCWRCGSVVVQKEIEQWYLRITDYVDSLLWNNTDQKISNNVDWPRSVREGQNNWIGRSEGVEIKFQTENSKLEINVFTTRPDTLFGATFMVLAPEHPIVENLLAGRFDLDKKNISSVKGYVESASKKTELERKEQKEKTGVFTGLYSINPLNKRKIPIWVADYVLYGYGTGAIMAVPAHDQRDFEFAKKFNLEIIPVIESKNHEERGFYTGSGKLINSDNWNGLRMPEEIETVKKDLEKRGIGKRRVTYHLRDWSVSRQRYWGTPVPILYCRNCFDIKKNTKYGIDYVERDGSKFAIIPEVEKNLPVELPYEVDYMPKGKPPLASAKEWMNVICPMCGKDAVREAETLDTFFDSSWYFYRYLNPHEVNKVFDTELAGSLMPVDVYFGGSEHTLGHTLYARFFTKFFKDLGLIKFDEFAKKRVQHGVILGPDGFRMSKSRGNVVNPDSIVKDYGTDAVRIYLCFMMPYEATAPWNPEAITGIFRFLKRIWILINKVDPDYALTPSDLLNMHKSIKKVGNDIESINFNTAISTMMEWLNYLSAKDKISLVEYRTLILLLVPFAPHISEELWFRIYGGSKLNNNYESVFKESWPKHEDKYLNSQSYKIVVTINGRARTVLNLDASDIEDESIVKSRALDDPRVKSFLGTDKIKKVYYIKGKIINFVI